MIFDIEYRTCNCPPYEAKPGEGEHTAPVEHFEREWIAARRFRELVMAGKRARVHYLEKHISHIKVNGEHFDEYG